MVAYLDAGNTNRWRNGPNHSGNTVEAGIDGRPLWGMGDYVGSSVRQNTLESSQNPQILMLPHFVTLSRSLALFVPQFLSKVRGLY